MLKRLLCAALLLSLVFCSAGAETLTLPQGVTEIGEAAFEGDTALREVILPEGVLRVGDRAFSGCGNLRWITVPISATELGADWLAGCAKDVLIRTEAGSAACAFAQLSNIDYQAGTVYRALLIAQTYSSLPRLRLNGTMNDALGMKACLVQYTGTPYITTLKNDLTAEEMLSAISETFAEATSQDVSLFFYSGHGISSGDSSVQGALLGCDNQGHVTANQLRAALDQVPGRKIVIIDACYSGNLLTARSAAPAADASPEAFTASFIEAFSRKQRGLAADSYFVLTAAAADEQSFEMTDDGFTIGLFTCDLLAACGYDAPSSRFSLLRGDRNKNGVMTLAEIYDYIAPLLQGDGQHAQVYPQGCDWFGLMRK